MRKFYEDVLRQVFYRYLIRTRDEMAWTQAEMAKVLEMDERSFVELDHGNSGCSGLTLALFLSYCCEDPLRFLEDFKTDYEREAAVRL